MAKNNVEILFEDNYYIGVNKSSGILTIPDRFNHDMVNLKTLLNKTHGDVIPVHRLDKFTSGVNIFAKNAEAHRLLSIAFESREVEKYYHAIVDGVPYPESGRINVPITESTVIRGKMIVHNRGKESITDYKIEKNFGKFCLLYIRLHTGRMHQIRVHMQYLGHPLIVDPLYGYRSEFMLSEIKLKKFNVSKNEDEKSLLNRQPLHASKLVFVHPFTAEKISIAASLPKDMNAVINQMEKWIK